MFFVILVMHAAEATIFVFASGFGHLLTVCIFTILLISFSASVALRS